MNAFSHVKYAARTDIGRKRKNNEDAFGVFPDAGVFFVADGMGGGDDGEIASAAVVKSVGAFASSHIPPPNVGYAAEDLANGVSMAVNEASAWIYARAAERKLKGCGSTFVGICLDATAPADAIAIHAGDSRLYRIRGSAIKQITKDHSAAEMIGAKDESAVNPCFRGVILRAVGVMPTVEIERTPLSLKDGDRIVICSDGLSKMVDDRTIAAIMHGGATPESTADELIAAANDAGGTDNVTAVVIFIGKLPTRRPAISLEMPDSGTDSTGDSGEADTFSTGAGDGFGLEADTADGQDTMNTITVRPQHSADFEEGSQWKAKTRPLKIKTEDSRETGVPGRVFRIVAIAFAGVAALALVVSCCVFFARRAKARNEASEAERQRNVQELAKANASAEAVQRQRLTPEPATPKAAYKTSSGAAARERVAESGADDRSASAERATHVPPELVRACDPTNSAVFVRTVRRFPNKGVAESLQMRFRPLCDDTLSGERRLSVAAAITADVQDIARELREYSKKRIENIDAALAEHTTRVEFKEKLAAERARLAAFMEASERFVEMDPASASAGATCAGIMLGVANWFPLEN